MKTIKLNAVQDIYAQIMKCSWDRKHEDAYFGEFLVGSIMVGNINDATILNATLSAFSPEIEHVYKTFDSECEAKYQFGILVEYSNRLFVDYILRFLDEKGIWYVTDFETED